jgi:hypothetical protein
MNSAGFMQIAPLSGIVLVVTWLVGAVLIGGGFGYMTAPGDVIDIFNRNPNRVQIGALIAGFYSVVFLILFVGTVFSALREREAGTLAAVALGGGVVCAIALALGYGVMWVAAVRAGRPAGISPEYALAMNDLYSVLIANVLSVGLAAFIGAVGIASLGTNLFPTWLGWVSVVFAVGLLTPIHWIFEGLSFIWIVVVSIMMYRLGG